MLIKVLLSSCVLAFALATSTAANAINKDRFALADTDQDNRLTKQEFSAAFTGINNEAFDVIDQNKSSFIEREEWDAFLGDHKMMEKEPETKTPLLIEPPKSNK